MLEQRRPAFVEVPSASAGGAVDVTIVMPCLNEAPSLAHCIANAREALRLIRERFGLTGEIVVADNGSTDGGPQLATALGARVVPVDRRGYGAALIGGCESARGRLLLMGDSDGSYNFTEGVAMIEKLTQDFDLCIGSRFQGGIGPGAMPWKNRYIGNPALTGILNLFYGSRIDDAHCGLRAISKDAFKSLNLASSGMEFASEMVIKATLKKLRITQVPTTLSPDLRERAPHLRPWRDGWRHLRYMLMLCPDWLFLLPGLILLASGVAIAGTLLWQSDRMMASFGPFLLGNHWMIAAGAMICIGHQLLLFGAVAFVHAVMEGVRLPTQLLTSFLRRVRLEHLLVAGSLLVLCGVVAAAHVGFTWIESGYSALDAFRELMAAFTSIVVGVQTFFGAFLICIVAGARSDFAAIFASGVTTPD